MECTPVSAQSLYEYLKQLLSNELGIYSYSGNYEDVAICIGDIDDDVKASGLECVVPLIPDRKSSWMGDRVRFIDRYDILLVEHSPQDPKIQEAASKIARAFIKSYGVYKPGNSALQSLPQYRITIEFSDQLGNLKLTP